MPEKSNANVNGKNEPETYASTADYFAALEKWLHDVRMWQSVTTAFHYAFMTNQFVSPGAVNVQHLAGGQDGTSVFTYVTLVQNNYMLRNARRRDTAFRPTQERQHSVPAEGVEYRIPPVWKRCAAELFDFLILFFVKLGVTLMAVDVFHLVDVDKYNLDVLRQNSRFNYSMALEMTSEILFLEFIHRIVVCIFETFWLQHGIGGHVGGATPGKSLMGIRVVLCTKVTPIEGRPVDIVTVYPGTDVGLGWAFARSFTKNVVLVLLFPICIALLFFRHNRTGYDILCRTIVVEEVPRQRRLQRF